MNTFSFYNKSKIMLFIVLAIILLVVAIPDVTFAQLKDVPSELVPCGTDSNPVDCNFCHLFVLAQNIINFLVYFAVIVATIMFVYAGFLYLTGGDDSGQISRAKGILIKVLIGFIVVLSSWLIVDTIMKAFLNSNEGFGPWNEISC